MNLVKMAGKLGQIKDPKRQAVLEQLDYMDKRIQQLLRVLNIPGTPINEGIAADLPECSGPLLDSSIHDEDVLYREQLEKKTNAVDKGVQKIIRFLNIPVAPINEGSVLDSSIHDEQVLFRKRWKKKIDAINEGLSKILRFYNIPETPINEGIEADFPECSGSVPDSSIHDEQVLFREQQPRRSARILFREAKMKH